MFNKDSAVRKTQLKSFSQYVENRPGRRQCNNAIHTHTHTQASSVYPGRIVYIEHTSHSHLEQVTGSIAVCSQSAVWFVSLIFFPPHPPPKSLLPRLLISLRSQVSLSSQEPLISLIFCCHSIVTEVPTAELPGTKLKCCFLKCSHLLSEQRGRDRSLSLRTCRRWRMTEVPCQSWTFAGRLRRRLVLLPCTCFNGVLMSSSFKVRSTGIL